MRFSPSFALLGLVMFASPAVADGSKFYPPQGCTGYLSVQQANCKVSHYWTCEKDAAGMQWSAVLDQGRVTALGKIDTEAQWVESYDFSPVIRRDLIQPTSDPASMTELLATGVDSYDFFMVSQSTGERLRVVGYDRIIEENVVVDGETLHRTAFNIRVSNVGSQTPTFESEGSEFVSATYRRFFGGPRTNTAGTRSATDDSTPIDFIYPGEDGFFAKTPLYGCSLDMASLSEPTKGPTP